MGVIEYKRQESCHKECRTCHNGNLEVYCCSLVLHNKIKQTAASLVADSLRKEAVKPSIDYVANLICCLLNFTAAAQSISPVCVCRAAAQLLSNEPLRQQIITLKTPTNGTRFSNRIEKYLMKNFTKELKIQKLGSCHIQGWPISNQLLWMLELCSRVNSANASWPNNMINLFCGSFQIRATR